MAKDAYKSDKELRNEITVNNANDDTLQTWKVRETFHDKQTGMDAVVFERDVDGKKQVMVSFRGTEGDKIIEKNSLGIPMKPGEGMKDLKRIQIILYYEKVFMNQQHLLLQGLRMKVQRNIGMKRMSAGKHIINSNKLKG